jgi:hypothetical protein
MKKNYKIKLVAIAMFIVGSIGSVNAISLKSTASVVVSANTDNWALIKTENGIRAYITQYQSVDETIAYKIKFENTKSEDINLTWSLINKDSVIIYSEKDTQVKALKSIVIVDENNPISAQFGEEISDIQIKFNIQ